MPPIDKSSLPATPEVEPSASLCLTCSFGFCTISKALGKTTTDVRCTHPARAGTTPMGVTACDGHHDGAFDPVGAFSEQLQKALDVRQDEKSIDEILDELEAESDELEAEAERAKQGDSEQAPPEGSSPQKQEESGEGA